MKRDAAALQRYLREAARAWAIVITTPSFDVCLHPADALVFLNYALPHEAVTAADFRAEHASIERAFAARERTPRFEFVDGASPELAAELLAAGYREEPSSIAMTLDPAHAVTSVPPGIEFVTHTAETSDDDVIAAIRVRDDAFGLQRPLDAAAIAAYRAATRTARSIVAREDGRIVGAGTLMPVAHEMAEVAGVCVDADVRGRGIGGAITAHLANLAFAGGARVAFLTAASETASRVYARVGFTPAPFRVRAYIRAEATVA